MNKEHPIARGFIGRMHVVADRNGNMVRAAQRINVKDPSGKKKFLSQKKSG